MQMVFLQIIQTLYNGFMRVPSDPADYQNGEFASINFLFDGAKSNTRRSTWNRLQYFWPYIISNKISLCGISKSFQNKFEACCSNERQCITAFFRQSNTALFNICITKNYALDRIDPLNDQVTIQIAFNEFTYVTADPNMIVVDKSVFYNTGPRPGNRRYKYKWVAAAFFDSYLSFTMYVDSGLQMVMYIDRLPTDPKYGEILGVADWQGTELSTVEKLVDSVNDKKSLRYYTGTFTSINTTENFVVIGVNTSPED